jgi:hypothetical protein
MRSNADTLGGQAPSAFKVGCSSSTVLAAGACLETPTRAADTWLNAFDTCEAAGRRLPSPLELVAFGYANPTSSHEWVDLDF